MPTGGDVIQLTHQMTLGDQDILNVYYFEAVTGSADLSVLATWFNTNVVPDVKAVQHDEVAHDNISLVNLFDTGEVYDLALSGFGSLAVGDNYPTFISGAVRLLHATAGIRSGWKRYGPASEPQGAGSLWVAGHVTLLENIGDHLINPLSPVIANWSHVVVARIAYDPGDGSTAYRLPANQGEYNAGYPTSYEVSPFVTTQNTRKTF